MEHGNSFSFDDLASLRLESCDQCSLKDGELEELRKAQANFRTLKKKIIATDELLRLYRAEQRENQEKKKQITEWEDKYKKSQREVDLLGIQLKQTVEDMEPVKRVRADLELRIESLDKEKEKLESKVEEYKLLNSQYHMQVTALEQEKISNEELNGDHKKRNTKLENKVKQQGNKISKLQTEVKEMKVEATKSKRREKRLETRLQQTEAKLLKHLDLLVEKGLMKAAAKSKVMASVTRLDRNNTDASSDGEPTSDFDTADEDEGKEPCRENRESATAHPSVPEMSHHGAEEDGKRNEKSMSVPAPSLLPQPAQSLQSDKELLQPEKPCDSQETLVPPSKQPKLHGKERKKEDVERENLGDVVGRMEDDLHVPFLLSPLPPSPTPLSQAYSETQGSELSPEVHSPDASALPPGGETTSSVFPHLSPVAHQTPDGSACDTSVHNLEHFEDPTIEEETVSPTRGDSVNNPGQMRGEMNDAINAQCGKPKDIDNSPEEKDSGLELPSQSSSHGRVTHRELSGPDTSDCDSDNDIIGGNEPSVSSASGLLGDFLYASDSQEQPQGARRVRSSDSSEKENNSPLVTASTSTSVQKFDEKRDTTLSSKMVTEAGAEDNTAACQPRGVLVDRNSLTLGVPHTNSCGSALHGLEEDFELSSDDSSDSSTSDLSDCGVNKKSEEKVGEKKTIFPARKKGGLSKGRVSIHVGKGRNSKTLNGTLSLVSKPPAYNHKERKFSDTTSDYFTNSASISRAKNFVAKQGSSAVSVSRGLPQKSQQKQGDMNSSLTDSSPSESEVEDDVEQKRAASTEDRAEDRQQSTEKQQEHMEVESLGCAGVSDETPNKPTQNKANSSMKDIQNAVALENPCVAEDKSSTTVNSGSSAAGKEVPTSAERKVFASRRRMGHKQSKKTPAVVDSDTTDSEDMSVCVSESVESARNDVDLNQEMPTACVSEMPKNTSVDRMPNLLENIPCSGKDMFSQEGHVGEKTTGSLSESADGDSAESDSDVFVPVGTYHYCHDDQETHGETDCELIVSKDQVSIPDQQRVVVDEMSGDGMTMEIDAGGSVKGKMLGSVSDLGESHTEPSSVEMSKDFHRPCDTITSQTESIAEQTDSHALLSEHSYCEKQDCLSNEVPQQQLHISIDLGSHDLQSDMCKWDQTELHLLCLSGDKREDVCPQLCADVAGCSETTTAVTPQSERCTEEKPLTLSESDTAKALIPETALLHQDAAFTPDGCLLTAETSEPAMVAAHQDTTAQGTISMQDTFVPQTGACNAEMDVTCDVAAVPQKETLPMLVAKTPDPPVIKLPHATAPQTAAKTEKPVSPCNVETALTPDGASVPQKVVSDLTFAAANLSEISVPHDVASPGAAAKQEEPFPPSGESNVEKVLTPGIVTESDNETSSSAKSVSAVEAPDLSVMSTSQTVNCESIDNFPLMPSSNHEEIVISRPAAVAQNTAGSSKRPLEAPAASPVLTPETGNLNTISNSQEAALHSPSAADFETVIAHDTAESSGASSSPREAAFTTQTANLTQISALTEVNRETLRATDEGLLPSPTSDPAKILTSDVAAAPQSASPPQERAALATQSANITHVSTPAEVNHNISHGVALLPSAIPDCNKTLAPGNPPADQTEINPPAKPPLTTQAPDSVKKLTPEAGSASLQTLPPLSTEFKHPAGIYQNTSDFPGRRKTKAYLKKAAEAPCSAGDKYNSGVTAPQCNNVRFQTASRVSKTELIKICDKFCDVVPVAPLSPLPSLPVPCKKQKLQGSSSAPECFKQPQESDSNVRKRKKQKHCKPKEALENNTVLAHSSASNLAINKACVDLQHKGAEAGTYASSSISAERADQLFSQHLHSARIHPSSQEREICRTALSPSSSGLSPALILKRQSVVEGPGIKSSPANDKPVRTDSGFFGAVERAKQEMMRRPQAGSQSHSHILSREPQKQVPLFDPVSGSRKRKATPEVKAELETIKPVSSVSPARKSVKRKAADGASRPTPAKRRAMGAACRAGLLEQNVKDLVEQYYSDESTSADTVLAQLQQIGHLPLCWPFLIGSVIMLLQLEKRDLQREIIAACTSGCTGDDKGKQQSRVFLDKEEVRFMHLLLCLMEADSGCDRVQLLQKLWTAVFPPRGTKKVSVAQQVSICRLFVGLCRAEGRIEEARALVFHVVLTGYHSSNSFINILLAVAAVWPQVLIHHSQRDHLGMAGVLEHVVMNKMAHDPALANLAPCFKHLCGWQTVNTKSATLLSELVQALQSTTSKSSTKATHRVYELTCCVKLLCTTQDSAWVVDHFLERALRSAMMKWASKGGAELSPGYLVVICHLVGKIIRPDEMKSRKKVLHQLIHVHARKLLTCQHRDPHVDAACVDMLLHLAPFKPHTAFNVLHQWFVTQASTVPTHLKNRIVGMRNIIQSFAPPGVVLETFD